MELFSPITFLLSLVQSPFLLSAAAPSDLGSLSVFSLRMHNLTTPTKILVALYLVHYANRSTVSVLRNPSKRSPMHLATFVASVAFNIANGFLMGSWIGGRTRSLLDLSLMPKSGGVDEPALRSPLFWTGLALWAAGFVGNMISDEILFDIRRPDPTGKPKPRYAVPRGFLYSRPLGGISFPNYFTEWFEWFGFALACSTVGSAPVIPPHADAWLGTDVIPSISFLQYLTPPWLFFLSEILVMTPRALRGHQWYREKFGQEMPQARKAVIPGLL